MKTQSLFSVQNKKKAFNLSLSSAEFYQSVNGLAFLE